MSGWEPWMGNTIFGFPVQDGQSDLDSFSAVSRADIDWPHCDAGLSPIIPILGGTHHLQIPYFGRVLWSK